MLRHIDGDKYRHWDVRADFHKNRREGAVYWLKMVKDRIFPFAVQPRGETLRHLHKKVTRAFAQETANQYLLRMQKTAHPYVWQPLKEQSKSPLRHMLDK